MSYVVGLGGAFIYAEDPEMLGRWYRAKLGIAFDYDPDERASYCVFESRDPRDPERIVDTTFAIIPTKHRLPDGPQRFMLNFRVDDLDALLAELQEQGVPIVKRQDYDHGRFAWIRDPAGHKVELYEPLAE